MAELAAKVRSRLARLAGRTTAPRLLSAGPPPGLDPALLEDVCHQLGRASPHEVSHLNLSPFKDASGAYRVWCTAWPADTWTVVFKDSRYDHFDGPHLRHLPVTVGPAEYAVYASADGTFRDFLPRVYHCEEVTPGRRYRYLLEDVAGAFTKPTRPAEFIRAAGRLGEVGTAMGAWALRAQVRGLMTYDAAYCAALADYAGTTLDRYVATPEGEGCRAAWDEWPVMCDRLTRRHYFEFLPAAGVHGDFNPASVLLASSGPGAKVVDWEWAGLGLPHVDLAALLEDADDEVRRNAVGAYASRHPVLPPGDHERLFWWALLQVCVKNAAFLAAQVLDAATMTRKDRPLHIERSLAQAVRAARRL